MTPNDTKKCPECGGDLEGMNPDLVRIVNDVNKQDDITCLWCEECQIVWFDRDKKTGGLGLDDADVRYSVW